MVEVAEVGGGGAADGEHYPMPAKPGSHVAYARGSDLVVEWYDFGDHAPYESANLLIFSPDAQEELADACGLAPASSPTALAAALALQFGSYFELRAFAEAHDVAFRVVVDFQP